MTNSSQIKNLTVVALLIAIGTIIPIVSPFKIIIEPASFTFLSHVAIFLSMFISPKAAIIVALGTTAGFFFGGFPIVVVLRALSHIGFVIFGAIILKIRPQIIESTTSTLLFSLAVGLVHAVGEVLVVSFFYFNQSLGSLYYTSGFLFSVMSLVGLGTVVHSMVDFYLTILILKTITKSKNVKNIFRLYVA